MFLFYFIIIIIVLVCGILSVNLQLTFWLDWIVWHPFPICPQCLRHAQCLTQMCRSRLGSISLCIVYVTPWTVSISITSNLSKRKRGWEYRIQYLCTERKNRLNCWKRNIGKLIGQQFLWKAVTRNSDIIFAPWWCIMICIFSKSAWQITHL